MSTVVRKTISLPSDLAQAAEAMARAEGKTLSAVVQDALRQARERRLKDEFKGLQDYWSKAAQTRGVLTEENLDRYLNE